MLKTIPILVIGGAEMGWGICGLFITERYLPVNLQVIRRRIKLF